MLNACSSFKTLAFILHVLQKLQKAPKNVNFLTKGGNYPSFKFITLNYRYGSEFKVCSFFIVA